MSKQISTSALPTEPGEEWRDISGWEGLYRVSNRGRVWSVRSSRILSPRVGTNYGHRVVALQHAGHREDWYVHRLVAFAFLPPPKPGEEVCHGRKKSPDGSPCDWADNLSWGTHRKNVGEDMHRDGTIRVGESNPQSKLAEQAVREIRRLHAIGLSGSHAKHSRSCGHHTLVSLGGQFGVSAVLIGSIVRRQSWTYLEEIAA